MRRSKPRGLSGVQMGPACPVGPLHPLKGARSSLKDCSLVDKEPFPPLVHPSSL